MSYLLYFLAGLFLCNAVPHLTAGTRGEPFPTPFAKPPGKGNSSPVVNALWGAFNLLAGVALLQRANGVAFAPEELALAAGFVLIAVFLAYRFGQVRAGRA